MNVTSCKQSKDRASFYACCYCISREIERMHGVKEGSREKEQESEHVWTERKYLMEVHRV